MSLSIDLTIFQSTIDIIKFLSGLRTFGPSAYLKKGRLEDVLSLIQVLAFDTDSRRSEEGIAKEIQGKPKSAELWTEIAEDHAEFFRVSKKDKCPISLVSRFVSVGNESPRKPLSQEYTHSLLTTAIEIHDRQVKRSEKWTYLIPIWVALITGFFVVIVSIFTNGKNTTADTTYKVEMIDQAASKTMAPINDSVYRIEIVSSPDNVITIDSKDIAAFLENKLRDQERANGSVQHAPVEVEKKQTSPPKNN